MYHDSLKFHSRWNTTRWQLIEFLISSGSFHKLFQGHGEICDQCHETHCEDCTGIGLTCDDCHKYVCESCNMNNKRYDHSGCKVGSQRCSSCAESKGTNSISDFFWFFLSLLRSLRLIWSIPYYKLSCLYHRLWIIMRWTHKGKSLEMLHFVQDATVNDLKRDNTWIINMIFKLYLTPSLYLKY